VACADGWEDCNGDPLDGCETDTNTSVANCGACNQVCSLDNASALCRGGLCAVKVCNEHSADCNGLAPDGCEVETLTDKLSCGSCGITCEAKQGCADGVCGVCDMEINYAAASTSTHHSGAALVAWMYHPKNDEELRRVCIKAQGDAPVFDIALYGDTVGPFMLLQKWQASSADDGTGLWCTPLLPDGGGYKMYSGVPYWIATSATEYALAATGESVNVYASGGTFEAPTKWIQQSEPLGLIAKVYADCL